MNIRPEVIDTARRDLSERGWAVVHNLPFLSGAAGDQESAAEFATNFGIPSTRDGNCPVWTVAPRSDRNDATFSVRSGEAALHTDSQYHVDPEDLVCLFVVRPAADGGDTRLLSRAGAMAALRRHPAGDRVAALLSQPQWSWRPPEVFGGEPAPPRPVLGAGTIRWRADNLCPTGDLAQVRAAAIFEACTQTAPDVIRLRLDAGSALIVDNLRTLHGRTPFQDPSRRLLRIRLWSRA